MTAPETVLMIAHGYKRVVSAGGMKFYDKGELILEHVVQRDENGLPIPSHIDATEPVATEAVATEPVSTEPVSTEPVATEPVATESLPTEPKSETPEAHSSDSPPKRQLVPPAVSGCGPNGCGAIHCKLHMHPIKACALRR
eukprot:GHVS01003490.1.p1 GENE.GHVS01003490.1~~GHVS01003490.1.p1  ORF type:complete len:150 (+),score=9.20 GHVS01003490.1:30-452(+)